MTAVAVLRAHPAVAGPVGLLGFSQGGWVGMVAAARPDPPVDFLACVSGPGVGPAAQDRYRIELDLRAAGLPEDQIADGLAWIDERTARLVAGEDVPAVLAAQRALAGRPWYEVATRWFDSPELLAYLARLLAFEPADVLPRVGCPVLALHGGADPEAGVDRTSQLAPGFLPMLGSFLRSVG